MSLRKISRRKLLTTAGIAGAGAGATFFGPWKHNKVYAAASDKPLRIGLTSRQRAWSDGAPRWTTARLTQIKIVMHRMANLNTLTTRVTSWSRIAF